VKEREGGGELIRATGSADQREQRATRNWKSTAGKKTRGGQYQSRARADRERGRREEERAGTGADETNNKELRKGLNLSLPPLSALIFSSS
jgi:hypothetical protein